MTTDWLAVPRSRPRASRPGLGSPQRATWAQLLQRVFAIDVLRCPDCGGRRELIALLTQQAVVRKILVHLGLATQPPALAPARAPPEPAFAW